VPLGRKNVNAIEDVRNPIRESTGTARVETEVQVRPLEAPTEAEIAELASLVDQYRAHYGQAIQAGQTASWLRHNLRSGRLAAFIAEMQGEQIGFAVTMDVPASLRLGHYWQIRDLFVVPNRRRLGVARALLDGIHGSAIAAGAQRLAVQTEVDNAGAMRLYEACGFIPVEGYRGLALPLVPDEDG
jgi:GNAT superfamily N-acetyltransferase